MSLDTVNLASGHKMPLVGFGLWKVPADKAADIVYNVSETNISGLSNVNTSYEQATKVY